MDERFLKWEKSRGKSREKSRLEKGEAVGILDAWRRVDGVLAAEVDELADQSGCVRGVVEICRGPFEVLAGVEDGEARAVCPSVIKACNRRVISSRRAFIASSSSSESSAMAASVESKTSLILDLTGLPRTETGGAVRPDADVTEVTGDSGGCDAESRALAEATTSSAMVGRWARLRYCLLRALAGEERYER